MQNETPALPTLPDSDQSNGQQPSSAGTPVPPKIQSSKRREVLLIAALAAILFAAGGLYQYRQNQESNASQTDMAAATQQDKESGVGATDLDEAALAEESEEESVAADAPVSSTGERSSESTGYGSNSQQSQTRSVDFVKGGHDVSNGVVSVSSNLSANETGTCTFRFSLNGTLRVEHTSQITNSKVCAIDIPQSEFPKSAAYTFELTFVSTDGLAKASLAYEIEVQ